MPKCVTTCLSRQKITCRRIGDFLEPGYGVPIKVFLSKMTGGKFAEITLSGDFRNLNR